MDNMLGENKNLKDTQKDSIKDSSTSVSLAPLWRDHSGYYNKTNKLITALYMVTDTIDKEEPIRLKLRTLGVEILSDIVSLSKGTFDNLNEKITAILSFLNIASDIRMISEMNCNILRKEFTELKQSIQEFTAKNSLWFEEFVSCPSENEGQSFAPTKDSPSLNSVSLNKGQGTRIGVQKGSTLMKALSNVESKNDFGILKNKRREEIIAVIKEKKNTSGVDGATITDIKNRAKGILVSCGEKTLQRELVSMVKDNVLKKTGEKRWSQYFLG